MKTKDHSSKTLYQKITRAALIILIVVLLLKIIAAALVCSAQYALSMPGGFKIFMGGCLIFVVIGVVGAIMTALVMVKD